LHLILSTGACAILPNEWVNYEECIFIFFVCCFCSVKKAPIISIESVRVSEKIESMCLRIVFFSMKTSSPYSTFFSSSSSSFCFSLLSTTKMRVGDDDDDGGGGCDVGAER
jgi:hypothetical protein